MTPNSPQLSRGGCGRGGLGGTGRSRYKPGLPDLVSQESWSRSGGHSLSRSLLVPAAGQALSLARVAAPWTELLPLRNSCAHVRVSRRWTRGSKSVDGQGPGPPRRVPECVPPSTFHHCLLEAGYSVDGPQSPPQRAPQRSSELRPPVTGADEVPPAPLSGACHFQLASPWGGCCSPAPGAQDPPSRPRPWEPAPRELQDTSQGPPRARTPSRQSGPSLVPCPGEPVLPRKPGWALPTALPGPGELAVETHFSEPSWASREPGQGWKLLQQKPCASEVGPVPAHRRSLPQGQSLPEGPPAPCALRGRETQSPGSHISPPSPCRLPPWGPPRSNGAQNRPPQGHLWGACCVHPRWEPSCIGSFFLVATLW
ncbi:basic salivary proline-rich protein 2-like [Marmota monax]|uniref:basic salivary proline-rich protein 2-like n=1 Tax=Marmota monax TaxID=9995 RepID=UPI001EAFC04D|nr:basic salivary proline-rich protein 2-like [Marmota monax]